MIVCGTCEAREWLAAREAKRDPYPTLPATHISTTAGDGPAFPLCREHAQLAMVAGWGPVEISSEKGQAEVERLTRVRQQTPQEKT